jgi:hypothetical protein
MRPELEPTAQAGWHNMLQERPRCPVLLTVMVPTLSKRVYLP